MERDVKDLNILNRFCEEFIAIVEKHCKYIIVSGFVAIASGRTRGTEDIDLITEKLSFEKFDKLFLDLVNNGFECVQTNLSKEAYDYLIDNTSIRFTWKNKFLPEMKLKFAKDILDEYQLKNRIKLKLTGLDVWFSSINTNIAFKEELLKSPKDLEDAKHLRIVFAEMVNENEINIIKEMIKRLRL
ncbi:MAG: hypothetical protein ABH849_03500 [Nanoarchaeota archaeon]|nr:hypothetical protein [Nanoarchaeota archaeon]